MWRASVLWIAFERGRQSLPVDAEPSGYDSKTEAVPMG